MGQMNRSGLKNLKLCCKLKLQMLHLLLFDSIIRSIESLQAINGKVSKKSQENETEPGFFFAVINKIVKIILESGICSSA